MGPADEIQVVFVEELGYHFSSKREGHAPVVLTPAQHILIWIRPQQITQETLIWNICGSHDSSDLLHGLQVWRQA